MKTTLPGAKMSCGRKWEEVKDWPVVYHGTDLAAAASILMDRLKLPSSDRRRKRIDRKHGGMPEEEHIYSTPCLGLAACCWYAPFAPFGKHSDGVSTTSSTPVFGRSSAAASSSGNPPAAADTDVRPVSEDPVSLSDNNCWLQVVLQCRIRPGSYTKQATKAWKADWDEDLRLDPNLRGWDDCEFLAQSEDDIEVVGIMWRELGPKCNWLDFGLTADKVAGGCGRSTAQESWAEVLKKRFREQGLLMTAEFPWDKHIMQVADQGGGGGAEPASKRAKVR